METNKIEEFENEIKKNLEYRNKLITLNRDKIVERIIENIDNSSTFKFINERNKNLLRNHKKGISYQLAIVKKI